MGLGEATASHGQDKECAEDVRQVPVGCVQDKQDCIGAREAPVGHRQSIVGPEQSPGFQRQVVPKITLFRRDIYRLLTLKSDRKNIWENTGKNTENHQYAGMGLLK